MRSMVEGPMAGVSGTERWAPATPTSVVRVNFEGK